jgi:pimeloyl-ACP methyl ester carboxylesterase
MPELEKKSPSDFISPLLINGLKGRMLHLPAPPKKRREILFIYGHHSSLERWWGLVQDLNQYGSVTMPDLPGFGGMDSFYTIGKEPTVDALADYLASLVKLKYKRKKVTIIGISFGFVIVTRMLQRCPELIGRVDLLISVVGFSHKNDFVFTNRRMRIYRAGTRFFSGYVTSRFFRNFMLNPLILRLAYHHTHGGAEKFAKMSKEQHRKTMKFEVYLWHCNDLRTHMATSHEFLNLDNCHKQIDLPIWHISVDADRYFDNHSVKQHLGVIFNEVNEAKAAAANHAPSIIADMETAAPMIPGKIRRLLAKHPKA